MSIPVFTEGLEAPTKKEDTMLVPTLILSLVAAPEATPSQPVFTCTVTENTLEANNRSQETLVVSFASADRAAVLHLAVPAWGRLSFQFPAHGLTGHWLEVSSLSAGHFVSSGAMRLQGPVILNVLEENDAFEGPPSLGTLLPTPIAALAQFPTCPSALDVGVPPPSEDPVVDEVTDLRRRCRRPI